MALLFLLIPYQSTGQSAPPDEILKWEADISLFDSLNLVEQSDAGTLLVTGSSSVRLWDSIHTDLSPYRVMQRGYQQNSFISAQVVPDTGEENPEEESGYTGLLD